MKNIIEYLGIYPELKNHQINKEAIKEAKYLEKEYECELKKENYGYGFFCDLSRFYDPKTETLVIIKELKHIALYRIDPIKTK